MAPPIAEIRDLYGRFTGATSESFGATVHTLTPSALARAVQVRSTVAVSVGSDLRRAAWVGFIASLLSTFAQPFVVDALNPQDGFQSFILKILDRGDAWTIASSIVACVAFVAMVFTRGASRASQTGLVALGFTAVGGCVAGLPAAVALAVSVVVGAAILAFGALFMWILVSALCSAASS